MRKVSFIFLALLLFLQFGAIPPAALAASPLPSTTLINYQFEGNAADSSGLDNHGIIHGGVTFEAGDSGQAARLDGTTGYIELPKGLLKNAGEFTLSFRFKTEESGAILGYQNKAANTSSSQWIPILYIDSNGILTNTYWTSTGSKSISTTSAVNDNAWHQVILKVEANLISMYLDGDGADALVGQVAATADHLSMEYNQLGLANRSGYPTTGLGWTYFNGLLDDFSVSGVPPYKVSTTKLTATASPDVVTVSSSIALNVTGDDRGGNTYKAGDERYVPVNWTSTETGKNGSFTVTSAIYGSASYTPSAPGTYTVTATFQKQSWNGSIWATVIGADQTRTASVTVNGLPPLSAPQNVTAQPGSGQVSLSWGPVPGTVTYHIYQSETSQQYAETAAAKVAESAHVIQGLTDGRTYFFVIKADDGSRLSEASAEVRATPTSSSDEGTNYWEPSSAPAPADTGTDIRINNRLQRIGQVTTQEIDNRQVTKITVDADLLESQLDLEGPGATVTLLFNTDSEVSIGSLNGQLIKKMAEMQATIIVMTGEASYTLPAAQFQIEAMSKQFGKSVNLQDIEVQIEIAVPPAEVDEQIASLSSEHSFQVVAPPISFKITGIYEGIETDITEFLAYVERTIALESDAKNQIVTAVVVEPDGSMRHVPTKTIETDGQLHARINSLTNSIYVVVRHEAEFADTRNHWAETIIHDLGSRMIFEGMTGEGFLPDRDITRAEFAAVIARGLGLQSTGENAVFTDLAKHDPYFKDIQSAYRYGLISEFETGEFRPDERITREQAMTIIAKAMKITGLPGAVNEQRAEEVLRGFADSEEIAFWARNGVADAVSAGIVEGRASRQVAPLANLTRAETAKLLQALLQKSEFF